MKVIIGPNILISLILAASAFDHFYQTSMWVSIYDETYPYVLKAA